MNMTKRYDRPLTIEELAALPDEDIDYSDIPETPPEWFRNAKVVYPQAKRQMTLRLDSGIVDWFKGQGKGYQSRMNAVLRAYVEAQRDAEAKAGSRKTGAA